MPGQPLIIFQSWFNKDNKVLTIKVVIGPMLLSSAQNIFDYSFEAGKFKQTSS